ncbi:helix-turn-helix domain-containing protein [Streptomyces sp. NPDC001262]|uniref:helix-turn-helix domain-containing protein n=1 Tax=Streptomyces sp. NPDC001262 TaxID=3364552 RepID=UPI0036C8F387
MPSEPTADLARAFGSYVKAAAKRRGYAVDDQRSGAKARLAADSGMSPAAISRVLSGTSLPHPTQLEGLAKALGVPVSELLVKAGVVSEEGLGVQPTPRPALTLDDIAESLGIHSEANIELLRGLVRTLQQVESDATTHPSEGRSVEAQ